MEEGVRVLITGRNQKKLEQARDELAKRTGGEIHAVVADMTKESDIAKMIDSAKEKLGGVDIPSTTPDKCIPVGSLPLTTMQ